MKIKVGHNEKILYTEAAYTTRKDSVCSMKDNITKLLGLEDVIVKNVYEDTRTASRMAATTRLRF